jgi:phosphatidate cytidylyltransferase
LTERIISGTLFSFLVLLCIVMGDFTVFLGALALSFFCLKEFFSLVDFPQKAVFEGYALNFFAIVLAYFFRHESFLFASFLLFFFLFIFMDFAVAPVSRNQSDWLRKVKLLFLGFVYIALPFCFAIYIRALPKGAWWLLLGVASAAFCDTGAFFVGKQFGKRKLAPGISPGKTVEGAVGGLFFSVITAVLLGKFVKISMTTRIFLGFFLAIAAIVGDLFESFLKRKKGVKDSGSFLAGHGGVLDRLDSHLFALPILFFYVFFKKW